MAEIEAERRFRATTRREGPAKPRHDAGLRADAGEHDRAAEPVVRFESVDSFEARGGRIQHLPPGHRPESVLRFQHNRSAQA